MALIDDFKARFPEFVAATVDQYVPILEPVYPAYYGREYDPTNATEKETILNLIAHLLVMETTGDSAPLQSVNSQSVGSVAASYNQPGQPGGVAVDTFAATKYGQRFLALTHHRYGGVSV